jgi:Glycosyltransferase family 87
MNAPHRTTDERDPELLKARRHLLLLAMVLAVAVASLLQASVVRTLTPIDFIGRYAGGRLVDQDRSPYDRAELFAVVQELRPGLPELPFWDPPPTAAAFRLISQLPLEEAALAWVLLSVICLAGIGWLLTDLLGVRYWTTRLTIIGLLTLFGPVRGSLLLGQIEAVDLLPLFAAIWLCLRRPPTRPVTALSAALAVVALCKPQLVYLPVAVILVHCWRRDRLAAVAGATAAAVALVLLAWLAAPSAHWADWLAGLHGRPEGPGGLARLALLAGGVAGIALAIRAATFCWDSFEGRLLLAAACNGLGAAVVLWNPQWHVVLALPVLALLTLTDPSSWPRRDQAVLALVAALSLPDTLSSYTFYLGRDFAVIPLIMSALLLAAVALARLVRPAWAAATWLLAAALLLLPLEPWLAQAAGLVLCLAVLWLLPRLGASWTGPGPATRPLAVARRAHPAAACEELR